MTDQDPMLLYAVDHLGRITTVATAQELAVQLDRTLHELGDALKRLDAASQPPATDASGTIHIRDTPERASCGFWPVTECMTDDCERATCVECLQNEVRRLVARVFASRPGADARLREAAQCALDYFAKDGPDVPTFEAKWGKTPPTRSYFELVADKLRSALAASPPEEATAGQAEPTVGELHLLTRENHALRRERDDLRAKLASMTSERNAYKRDLDAEMGGSAALRKAHGARDNETMEDFIARLASAHPPSSEAREAQITNWLLNAQYQPCKPPNYHHDDQAYPAGFWLSATEVEDAVALMRSAPTAPPREDAMLTLRERIQRCHDCADPNQRAQWTRCLWEIDSLLAKPAAAEPTTRLARPDDASMVQCQFDSVDFPRAVVAALDELDDRLGTLEREAGDAAKPAAAAQAAGKQPPPLLPPGDYEPLQHYLTHQADMRLRFPHLLPIESEAALEELCRCELARRAKP